MFLCSLPKLSVVYSHQVMKSRPLFFLFDSVHILKYISNNSVGQKNASKCMLFTNCPILYLTESSRTGISVNFEILLEIDLKATFSY